MEGPPRKNRGTRVVMIACVVALLASWIVPSCRSAGEYRVEISGKEPYPQRLCAALSAAGAAEQISKDARPVLGILGTGSRAAAEIGLLPAAGDHIVLKLTLRRRDAKGLSKAQIRSFFVACEHEIRKMLPGALEKCAERAN